MTLSDFGSQICCDAQHRPTKLENENVLSESFGEQQGLLIYVKSSHTGSLTMPFGSRWEMTN